MIPGLGLLLCVLAQVPMPGPDSPEWVPRNIVVDFLALEARLQAALRKGDQVVLEEFLASEFEAVIIGKEADGLHRRQWPQKAPERDWEFQLNEVRSRCMRAGQTREDSDCWVVELNGMIELKAGSGPAFLRRPFMQDLWVRRAGQWRLASRLLFLPPVADQ